MTTTPRMLCIGDTVVDAFIELQDAHVTCAVDNTTCEISMKFGDKIPFTNDYILYGVGNSANAAVSVARLGMGSALLTHLGQDDNGDKSVQALLADRVDTSLCYRDGSAKTNYHYVLWYKPERTILVKHEHYTYDFATEIAPLAQEPDWVYLSSIGSGTEDYHLQLAVWLAARPAIKLAFQPGTFQMALGVEKLQTIYARAELFFCNVEEAARITGDLISADDTTWVRGTDAFYKALRDMAAWIMQRGPKVVVITDGPKGAYSFDGASELFCPIYPDIAPPLERTGAGDAYASTFTAFYAQGMSVRDCMVRAPINSMNVVQHVGAQKGLLTLDQLNDYLAKAPAEYAVVEL